MLDGQLVEVLQLGLRTFFILARPILIVGGVVGTLASALQGATALHDRPLSYGIVFLATAVALYLIFPFAVPYLVILTQRAFG